MKIYFLDVIFKHYLDFNGRSTRMQFWLFMLFNLMFAIVLGFFGKIGQAYILIVFLPSLGIIARRLRDAGFSPWLLLIAILIMWGSVFLGSQVWSPHAIMPNLGEYANLIFYMIIPLAGFWGTPLVMFVLFLLPSKK